MHELARIHVAGKVILMPFFPKAQRDECSLETFALHTHDVDANVPQNAIQPNQPA